MPIPVAVVEQVKASHDLVEVVRSHGITLTRKGKDWIGLCPFHSETAPSFTVNSRQQLYHCFGCPPDGKTGGDVISFVSRIRGLGFREALAALGAPVNGDGANGHDVAGAARAHAPAAAKKAIKREGEDATATSERAERGPLSPEQQKLLARVVGFYQAAFREDPRGREYLAKRGITDRDALEAFGVGFAAGRLCEALPLDRDLTGELRALGILTSRGKEAFTGCVVFPLTDPASGTPVGLYGRRIEDGEVNHLYLSGPRRGLVHWQAAKRSRSLLIAESVIDALALVANGFRNTIPLYGTQGLTADHEALFAAHGTEELYLVLDADDAGRVAAALYRSRLAECGMRVHVVDLPEKDAAAFFLRHTPEEMEACLKRAHPKTLERSDLVVKRGETGYETTAEGFALRYGARRYEVRGISKAGTQLRVVLRAELVAEGQQSPARLAPAETETLDLYSSRRRATHAKVLARLFGETEPLVRDDLLRLVEKAEAWVATSATRKAEAERPKMTDAERTEALAFLVASDLPARIVADLTAVGLCGEETNKLLGYLVATSRKLAEPLSMVIQSRSGAGKSALQDAVLSLMPPEDLCKYTRITDQALFYREGSSLKHKILALEEAEGMGGAVYSLRALQSAGEVRILSTGKDPATGQLVSRESVVAGPVAVFMTTTRPSTEVDGELASRNLFTTVDESRERTEEILRAQRDRWSLAGLSRSVARSAIERRHRNAQRVLDEVAVVNRYAAELRFPPEALRARRDQAKYLGIVATVAFLRQWSRPLYRMRVGEEEVRFVEVLRDDVALGNALANAVLGHSLDELSPPARKLLGAIHELVLARSAEEGVAPEEWAFTRREVREWIGWSDFQVKVHVRELEELEYLYARQGRRGREYVYELRYGGEGKDGQRFVLGLTPALELTEPPPFGPEVTVERGPWLEGDPWHLEGEKAGLEGGWSPQVDPALPTELPAIKEKPEK